jgi:hypothetical protein
MVGLFARGSALRKTITYTQDNTNTKFNPQTSLPPVGFERTTPVFERANTVDALDRAPTAMGTNVRHSHALTETGNPFHGKSTNRPIQPENNKLFVKELCMCRWKLRRALSLLLQYVFVL